MARFALRARADGFTLVEVLVALAVLAIALSAVMRVVTQSIDTTAGLRDRTIALGVAQDQLSLHYLQRDWPDPDTTSGIRVQGGREWRWQEQVVSTPMPDFRRVEIEVSDAAREDDVLARLVGFLRKPAPAGGPGVAPPPSPGPGTVPPPGSAPAS